MKIPCMRGYVCIAPRGSLNTILFYNILSPTDGLFETKTLFTLNCFVLHTIVFSKFSTQQHKILLHLQQLNKNNNFTSNRMTKDAIVSQVSSLTLQLLSGVWLLFSPVFVQCCNQPSIQWIIIVFEIKVKFIVFYK